MADGVVVVDRDGIIRFANPAAQQLFGRTADDLVGRELGFPVVVGDTAGVEVVRPTHDTVTAELRVVDTDWDGEQALLVSLRDVTDRKRAEERAAQLERERRARVEAEAASQAKSEFLALMSHELRTPLNAVIGYADLLDLGVSGPLSTMQQQQVARIRSSGHHLLSLVNEVLDLARVEAGRLTLQQGTGHARQTIDSALTLVQPIAEARGIQLGIRVPGDCEIIYEGDEDRVRQILVNLLNNAIKFTEPGGRVEIECGDAPRPTERAKLMGSGPWMCFRVSDTGRGIPSDKLVSIFDPFTQVESGKTRSRDGSGLGLTISRRLARLMKGDLTVESRLGEGSAFTLWLPDATATASSYAKWRERSPELAERLHGLGDVGKVLIRELETLLEAFVTRLREEPIVHSVHALRGCQLSSHLGEYIAGIATTFISIEEMRGQPSSVITDGARIHATIAECHGAQRGELGWSAELLHREWTILREELERLLQRHRRELLDPALSEAMVVIERMITQAVDASCRALNRSRADTGAATLLREHATANAS
jgi:signal transduction histidine kinase